MEDSFHFALLRVSVIHILKAAGFDKCRPSVVNTLTGLYIEYFKLLLQTTNKFSQHRGDILTEVMVQDISAALLEVGFLKPSSFESNLDAFDVPSYSNLHDYSTKSAEAFKNWLLYSDQFNVLRKLATVPRPLLKSLVQKRKVDDDKLNKDQKQRKLKKKQEFYNQFQGTNGTTGGPGHDVISGDVGYNDGVNFNDDDDDDDDEAVDSIEQSMNWLRYASEKDLKLGTDLRWINTALDDETRALLMNDDLHPIDNKENRVMEQKYGNYSKDHEVIGVLEGVKGLFQDTLPYEISYDPELLNDLIDMYEDYARRHPRPVSPEKESEQEIEDEEDGENELNVDEEERDQENDPGNNAADQNIEEDGERQTEKGTNEEIEGGDDKQGGNEDHKSNEKEVEEEKDENDITNENPDKSPGKSLEDEVGHEVNDSTQTTSEGDHSVTNDRILADTDQNKIAIEDKQNDSSDFKEDEDQTGEPKTPAKDIESHD